MRKTTPYLTILFLLLMMSSCTCLKWHTKTPEGLIEPSKAKELHNNYKNNQYRFINESIKNDSVIIGEETVFENKFLKTQTPPSDKKNGGDGFGHLEIELKQASTDSGYLSGYEDTYEDKYEALFSLDELGAFLVSTERKAKALKKENIGIRVYYGSYIINKQLKATVIFVPTHFDSTINGKNNIGNQNLHENIYELPCLNMGNAGQPPVPYNPN